MIIKSEQPSSAIELICWKVTRSVCSVSYQHLFGGKQKELLSKYGCLKIIQKLAQIDEESEHTFLNQFGIFDSLQIHLCDSSSVWTVTQTEGRNTKDQSTNRRNRYPIPSPIPVVTTSAGFSSSTYINNNSTYARGLYQQQRNWYQA